jgi:hypothetical protein|nr:MAG TPA: hypothetical protein [Caudoviricetes sp.]
MACISKLANAIAYNCDTGATGLVSALIINKADIASFTLDSAGGAVMAINLVPGAKAYRVDTVKRSLVVSKSLKVNDGAPNAFTHTATITDTTNVTVGTHVSFTKAISNGSFVILYKPVGASHASVVGLYYGMRATAFDQSSHDNGSWTTVTIETPENVIGEDNLSLVGNTYDAMYAAAAV